MKYFKYISLFGAIIALITTTVCFIRGNNAEAYGWLNASIWAMSTFVCELNIRSKEQQIDNLKSNPKKEIKPKNQSILDEIISLEKETPNDMDPGNIVRKYINSKNI